VKIGFDISQTGKRKAGCGFFADSLLGNLAARDSQNEYFLYPVFGDFFWDPDWATSTRQIPKDRFSVISPAKTFQAAKDFWNHPPRDFEAKLGGPDLIHANNFFCPTSLQQARLVYTLYDLSFVVCPEWTTEENRVGCFRGVFHASVHADWILAISRFTRTHFLSLFPHYPPERVTVVYPASRFADSPAVARPKALTSLRPERFWLHVGSLEPRKNQLSLLKSYARLKAEGETSLPLVFAGGKGWLIEDFEEKAAAMGLHEDVLFLGYVEDEVLCWLYQNCFAFVYPTVFEGFGLPVLEAMSLGAPVITTAVASLPEVVGEAALLVQSHDESGLFAAMRRIQVEESLRRTLQEKGRSRSRKFSWESTASLVLSGYEEVMNRPRLFAD